MPSRHVPAMPLEVARHLDCRPGDICVDGTLGGSGHASNICDQLAPGGVFIGIDQDRAAVDHARRVLACRDVEVHLFHDNFTHLPDILSHLGLEGVDGILLDLGLSLYQLEGSGRGFSFQREEPLDMRMDTDRPRTAADMVNSLAEGELKRLLQTYGEERWAGRIARRIVDHRKTAPIRTSAALADIVTRAVPGKGAGKRIHPATRTFMALRIAVNGELDRIDEFMDRATDCLNTGGRLVVLSFHSLEDRIVKQRIRALAKGCACPPKFPICVCGKVPVVRNLTPKAARPTEEEIMANPMARSTRLRAMIKL
ncbi:MAG: 16S rRNA (cytosine(1402)-N(4))-methyltransferase RsmH [Desulfobacterales bacterium]|nr:16S rRNA (cytosine(1402)-N(4))-methyltransferase RsmH [Desulfobacterales bacterium]